MITRIIKAILVGLVLLSCEPQLVDAPIPIASFTEFQINLFLPEYSNLRLDGGQKAINSIGVRGVIVYRVSATVYHAYERNCSFQPNDACATVDIHASNLYMVDTCCGSTFNFENGQPTGGPAWRPLRQYRTELNGSLLTITDEIVN
jgi:nitrite reductase/ring-hydroxylating ferredoxin subunit